MSPKTVRRWSTGGGALALLLAVGSLAGCSKGDPCWVSGKVTLNNQPIPEGDIRFMPSGGTPGIGASGTIKDGQYEIPKSARMYAGKYVLIFSATRPATKAEIARMGDELPSVGDESDEDEQGRPKAKGAGGAAPVPVIQLIPERYNTTEAKSVELAPGANTKDFSL